MGARSINAFARQTCVGAEVSGGLLGGVLGGPRGALPGKTLCLVIHKFIARPRIKLLFFICRAIAPAPAPANLQNLVFARVRAIRSIRGTAAFANCEDGFVPRFCIDYARHGSIGDGAQASGALAWRTIQRSRGALRNSYGGLIRGAMLLCLGEPSAAYCVFAGQTVSSLEVLPQQICGWVEFGTHVVTGKPIAKRALYGEIATIKWLGCEQ